MRALALISFLALVACAPVPMTPERAEAQCRKDASLADGVRGKVGVGIGTGGVKARGSIKVTDRVFNPQSEEEFLTECIDRRLSGRPAPTTVGITLGGST